ncbi:MAG TPA: glucose-6-phosphate dehydrogenase [Terriglobia bacterium]|nr:glucose-6-phosphate dehydrogenase [Terriglobia bacterium]
MAQVTLLPNPLREGMRMRRSPDPCVMVIFGASGDLTDRKLMPALYYLAREHMLPAGFSVIGCSRTPYSNEQFRKKVRQAIVTQLQVNDNDPILESFCSNLYYLTDNFGDRAAYSQIVDLTRRLDSEGKTAGNRLFYLATPPSFFPVIVEHLGGAGLAKPVDPEKTWTRIVIEKPFGRDLQSARDLNRIVTGVFHEDQVYRIDHYLGKETVQNLLVFRFANGIFEPVWNRRYIDHVQIAVAESLGVENRGSYYEESGLLRDMIQNHVLQLLSLVAMEPPASFEAKAVRDEKAKVLSSIRPLPSEHLQDFAVRGQYAAGFAEGKEVPAYRAESSVSPRSTTETYAALKLQLDNWRWAGVPFYLRSGKRLAKRVSEITIYFKGVPHLLFKDVLTESIRPNVLSVRIQPDEGISLQFSAKVPGTAPQIRPVRMDFRYGESFGASPPTAYETLLLDCMLGDSTLFNRDDAVDISWELVTPILDAWKQGGEKGLALYEAGSWGPKEADEIIERDGRSWHRF